MASDLFSDLPDLPPDSRANRAWVQHIKDSLRPNIFEDLTPRERELLDVLSKGKSNKEIARELCITSHTVRAHIRSILHKLKVESRTHAVSLWLRWLGGLPLDDPDSKGQV